MSRFNIGDLVRVRDATTDRTEVVKIDKFSPGHPSWVRTEGSFIWYSTDDVELVKSKTIILK